MRLLLPTPIGRFRLRVFWCQLAVLVGLLTGALLAAAGVVPAPAAWGTAFIAAITLALPGLVRPYSVQWAYRGWNFAARRAAGYAERYITFVCFATVMVASSIGSPTKTFERAPVRRSMWFSRGTQPPSTYASQDTGSETPAGSSSWSADLRSWARSSGHPPAVALLPFLMLLRTVADERSDTPTSSNIYTLY
jgi:hypothetical protein